MHLLPQVDLSQYTQESVERFHKSVVHQKQSETISGTKMEVLLSIKINFSQLSSENRRGTDAGPSAGQNAHESAGSFGLQSKQLEGWLLKVCSQFSARLLAKLVKSL